ncbi:MAG: hypothetical protein JSS09_03810 [Verrucomicrobia bacterium]|nr:hypothetical protein [Verrucomicrobiota bacterium]
MIDTAVLRFTTPVDSALTSLESFEKCSSGSILAIANQIVTTTIGKASKSVYFYFYSNQILNEIIENSSLTKEIILNYNITEQEDLKTLASSLLEKSPLILVSSIDKFGITDQEFLKNLASSLLEKSPLNLFFSIDKFGITDRDFLERINTTLKDPINRIDLLIKSRLSDSNLELNRLKKIPRIEKSLNEISKTKDLSIEHKMAIAQSIELRECLKDKYYVINHGQNNKGIIANIVAKKVTELFESKKLKYFEVLRHDIFLKDKPKDRDVTWYKTTLKKELSLTDHNFREELICGDITLERTNQAESAIHFSTGANNIAIYYDPDFMKKIIQKIVKHYFPTEGLIKEISEEINSVSKNLTGGTLYSICIPKDKFHSIAYLAHPYGRPLDYPSHITNEELDSWQEGTSSIDTQVRLLTRKLTQDNGILIIPHSTLSQSQLDKIESVVENCLLNAKKRSMQV